jgi:hypothetical protein
MPQFTSSFFDSLDIHTQNSFSSIASEDSIGPPDACSSPKAAHQRGKQKVTRSWNKFTILNLNFQSIKNKKAETLNIIDSYNPDIIIGTKTWLNDSVHNSEIFPPNYNIYRRDRRDGFGGVLVAVKADIVSDHLDVEINTESVYTSITLEKGKQLIVGALYRPPSSSIEYMDNMCTTLETLTTRHKKAIFWVGGDLYLPDINWSIQAMDGNSNAVAINHRLLDCTQNCGLEQMVNFPTRQRATLDLFFAN